jgi:gas vesicle protein
MRAGTKIGLVTGGVIGAAVGAGLLMSGQGRQLRDAVNWGADHIKHALHSRIG